MKWIGLTILVCLAWAVAIAYWSIQQEKAGRKIPADELNNFWRGACFFTCLLMLALWLISK